MAIDARRTLWMERIQEWRTSGLTQRAYARQLGVPTHQVRYWVVRLGETNAAAQLVRISIKHRAPANQAAGLTLHSPSGWTVTMPPNLPAAWLGELLQALR